MKLTLVNEVSILNILAFVSGTWIVNLHIIMQKSFFCKNLILFVSLIWFVSQKHILILQFQWRRSLLLLMIINYFVEIILVIPKEVGYISVVYMYMSVQVLKALVTWLSCLWSANPKHKRFICYSILFGEPESWLLSNFPQRTLKITFQYH